VSPDALLDEGYDAVYIACGFPQDALLNIDGASAAGAFGALDLLLAVSRDESVDLGDHVVVIGGGNTAMDAARTSQRLLGRPVTVVYRRTKTEMPAELEELEDLLAEGNELMELVSPTRVVVRDGRVEGLACIRNELGPPDTDGRRRPQPVEGSDFTLNATAVIFATGQRADLRFLEGTDLTVRTEGGIVIQEATGRASEGPIYAGGDVARGPETIIAACADGRRAAEAICSQLEIPFRTVPWEPGEDAPSIQSKIARARKVRPTPAGSLPLSERSGFDVVEQTFTKDEAAAEAARCLQCATLCDKCVEVCPNRANLPLEITPCRIEVPTLTFDAGLKRVGVEEIAIEQRHQIVHVEDFCNACGNCSTFCVHAGDPFKTKPRLFLTRSDYEADEGLAYYATAEFLLRKEVGAEAQLLRPDAGYAYRTGPLRATFSAEGAFVGAEADGEIQGVLSLRPAVEMIKLWEGLRRSLPQVLETAALRVEGDA